MRISRVAGLWGMSNAAVLREPWWAFDEAEEYLARFPPVNESFLIWATGGRGIDQGGGETATGTLEDLNAAMRGG